MQAANVKIRFEDLAAHLGNQSSANRSNLLVVVFDGIEHFVKVWRYNDALALHPSRKFLPRLDGHDPRDDRYGDASNANPLDPFGEDSKVVEHLGEDEIGARIDLLLEKPNLGALRVLVGSSLWVSLRESSDGDIKVVAVLCADIFDEIDGLGEAAFGRRPVALAIGRVATKGEDVLTAMLFGDLRPPKTMSGPPDGGANDALAFRDSLTLSSGTVQREAGGESSFMKDARGSARSLSVQHRCMQVSMPIVCWHTCTSERVRSEFLPPAPL